MIITPNPWTVTVGGVELPLAVVSQATDCLAPEVDSCDIVVPWGDRRIAGVADPDESLPAANAEVVATCGSYTWRGLLMARRRSASGSQRFLRLRALGPGIGFDKAYLPSFSRVGLSGVIQTPGGPRFAPGTRSAGTTTVAGIAVRYLTAGGGPWPVSDAITSYLAHVTAFAELPAVTLDLGSADLTRILPDIETDGLSAHAGMQAILGTRLGLVWRALLTGSGWAVRVRGLSGTGQVVDLATGDVTDYDIGEDWTSALASLETRGAGKHYVLSADGKTTGDIISDWTSGDETDRAAGDESSPAYRRFRLANFALPDGSPSITATPIPTLPISLSTSLLTGSSPWQLFAQLTADSTWIRLSCSISVGGGRIWIEGIDPAAWATWSRIRMTLCLAPRSNLAAIRTGGAGIGRGLSIVGSRHVSASGAAVRLSGGGLAVVTGTLVSEQDPIDNQADGLWQSLGGAQIIGSWTRVGVAGGLPDPGDRVTGFLLPRPGLSSTAVSCDAICSSRTVVHVDGKPQTTWQISPRPFVSGAVVR